MVRQNFYSKAQKRSFAYEYKAGHVTALQLAERCGVSKAAIYRWLKDFGLEPINKPNRPSVIKVDQHQTIIQLYKEGLSFDTIGRKLDTSNTQIKNVMEQIAPELIRRKKPRAPRQSIQQEPRFVRNTPELTSNAKQPATTSVLPPSSIRPLTKQELMQGRAGGYGVQKQLEGLYSHGRESRPSIQQKEVKEIQEAEA